MRLSTWAWIETSSADSGSSAITTSGSTASARAIPTRCRSPPLNACGRRPAWAVDSPTVRSSSATRSGSSLRATTWCTLSTSVSDWPMVIVGFSDEYGSWNTPWTCRRTARAVSLLRSRMLTPRYRMSPLVGVYRPSSRRPKVVLPEPVSPTSARVSPRRIVSDTPSTALSVGRARPIASRPAEKCLATCSVSMIGTSASAASAAAARLSAVTALPRVSLQGEPAGVGAAVHLQHRAGDVARVAGRQEEHRAGDVPRVAGLAERDRPDQRRAQVVGRAVRVGVAPAADVDVAGGDHVHPDPVRPEFHGEHLAHGLDRRLRRAVGGAGRAGAAGRPGRDADHGGVPHAAAHAVPGEGLGHHEGPGNVH